MGCKKSETARRTNQQSPLMSLKRKKRGSSFEKPDACSPYLDLRWASITRQGIYIYIYIYIFNSVNLRNGINSPKAQAEPKHLGCEARSAVQCLAKFFQHPPQKNRCSHLGHGRQALAINKCMDCLQQCNLIQFNTHVTGKPEMN